MRTFPDKISHREIRFDDSAILAPPSATFCTNTKVFDRIRTLRVLSSQASLTKVNTPSELGVFTLVTLLGENWNTFWQELERFDEGLQDLLPEEDV